MKRDTKNSILGGVCSGMAQRFELDRTVVRAIFVIALFGFGFAPLFLAYMAAWLFLDASDDNEAERFNAEKKGKVIQEDLDVIAGKLKNVETAFVSAAKTFKNELGNDKK